MEQATTAQTLLEADYILEKLQLQENMKVADLGCGTSGKFIFPCARIVGKKGQVYAVDILKDVLDVIKRRIKQENIKNITSVWSDLEIFNATKIESSCLDVALLINTLFQSKKRADIIREAVRILKKDGKLLVIEWKNVSLPFGPSQSERVDINLLKQGAQKLGLKIEDEFNAGPYHYAVLFVKV